jgi:hypothetical protein
MGSLRWNVISGGDWPGLGGSRSMAPWFLSSTKTTHRLTLPGKQHDFMLGSPCFSRMTYTPRTLNYSVLWRDVINPLEPSLPQRGTESRSTLRWAGPGEHLSTFTQCYPNPSPNESASQGTPGRLKDAWAAN